MRGKLTDTGIKGQARPFATQNSGLSVFLAASTLLLGVAAISMTIQTIAIFRKEGDFPTILAGISAAMIFAAVVAAAAFFTAAKIAPILLKTVQWLTRTGLVIVILLGLLSVNLLLVQIETWLLNGSHITSSVIYAAILTACAYFLWTASALHREEEQNQRSGANRAGLVERLRGAKILSIPTIFLALVVLIRSAAAGYYAKFSPLMCDEASTFWLFSPSPLAALTRYDAPNNHVINSLLVWISRFTLGTSEAALRFFPFIAGIAGIIACFALARRMFDRYAAMFAIAAGAASIWVLFYSFQARGYIYIYLFAPLAVLGLLNTFEQPAGKSGWFLFAAAAGLAFGALPTMLYFWVSILIFGVLAFSFQKQLHLSLPTRWLKQFFLSMGAVLAIAGAFYLNPVFSVFQSGRLSQNFFTFADTQPRTMKDLFEQVVLFSFFGGSEISSPVYHFIGFVVLFGLVAGVVWLALRKQFVTLLLFACLVFTPGLILIFADPIPFPRIFFYLLPFASILSGCGLYACVSTVVSIMTRGKANEQHSRFAGAAYAAAALAIFLALMINNVSLLTKGLYTYHARTWPAQSIAGFLEKNAQPTDAIVADNCLEYMLSYEIAPQYHITTVFEWWETGTPDAKRVFVLPAHTDPGLTYQPGGKNFTYRTCENRSKPHLIAVIGDKSIYLCENQ